MKIDLLSSGPPLRHVWRRCFGQGRAGELLRSDTLEHVALLKKEVGLEYLRFHGLFHDELSVVTRRKDGGLSFHWRMLERVFDSLLALGIRPFVELGPMPRALASGREVTFLWEMNVTSPRDYAEWGALIESFALHCIRRYGAAEMRTWYFEVWNEPNLGGFWTGTFDEYCNLYRHAAAALKKVDSKLRVGGPATAQGKWIPEFVDFCSRDDVPLDFVSTHSYLQDEQTLYPCREGSPHAPSDYLLDQFVRVRDEVAASANPQLEIHWTEWNSLSADSAGLVSWTENPSVDSLYAGSFALHQAVRADSLCDSLSWWAVSDIFGEDGISPLAYSHTYGLINSLGIPKPSFHAFKWLARMQGERLAVTDKPEDSSCQVLVTREGACVRALLWFHPPVENAVGKWAGRLEVGFDSAMLLTRAYLSAGAGSGFEDWVSWGKPSNLTPSLLESLRASALPAYDSSRIAPGDAVPFLLKPYEVMYFEWTSLENPAERRGIFRTEDSNLEGVLADKTKAASEFLECD